MDDLFSFLDVAPQPHENTGDIDENELRVDAIAAHGVKRKAGSSLSQTPPTYHEPIEDFPSEHKKLRTEPPNPVLLDDFETEAKREVAASAGLTGTEEAGSRLELKHQVCLSTLSDLSLMIFWNRFDTKLLYRPVTITFRYHNMSLLQNLTASTNSNLTLSRKSQYMPFNATKACWCRRILAREKQSSQNMLSHSL